MSARGTGCGRLAGCGCDARDRWHSASAVWRSPPACDRCGTPRRAHRARRPRPADTLHRSCRLPRRLAHALALPGPAAETPLQCVEALQLGRHAPLLEVGFETLGVLEHVPKDANLPRARRAQQRHPDALGPIDADDAAELLVTAPAGATLGGEGRLVVVDGDAVLLL